MPKINRQKHELEASTTTAGRLASQVAIFLMGKQKPEFTPQTDHGDFVVVANIDKLKFTGNKLTNKIYYHHTGYIGNLKSVQLKKLMETKPGWLFKKIVRNMLPDNRLRADRLKRLSFK